MGEEFRVVEVQGFRTWVLGFSFTKAKVFVSTFGISGDSRPSKQNTSLNPKPKGNCLVTSVVTGCSRRAGLFSQGVGFRGFGVLSFGV